MASLAEFGWYDWLAVLICVFFVGLGTWVMPRVWRDELATGGEHAPGWWPWGEALWQGYRRLPPLGLAWFVVALVFGLGSAFVPEQPQGPFVRPYWAVIPFLSALGLISAAMLGVVFLNRPKFIVPPHLREHPGALAAWLADWWRFRAKRRSRARRLGRKPRR